MIRAVIDANVLVSGLLAAAGNEALIILAIHQGFVYPCFWMRSLSWTFRIFYCPLVILQPRRCPLKR